MGNPDGVKEVRLTVERVMEDGQVEAEKVSSFILVYYLDGGKEGSSIAQMSGISRLKGLELCKRCIDLGKETTLEIIGGGS